MRHGSGQRGSNRNGVGRGFNWQRSVEVGESERAVVGNDVKAEGRVTGEETISIGDGKMIKKFSFLFYPRWKTNIRWKFRQTKLVTNEGRTERD